MRRLVCLVMLLALAGCGGSSSGPKTLPPVSPSPSPSSLPSPTPSLTPEQQVLAAVRAYYAALNHAGATSETGPLALLSTPDCSCRSVVKYIDKLTAQGQHLRDARDDVISVSVQQVTKQFAIAVVTYSSPAHQVIDKTGKVVDSFPATKVQTQLALKPVGSKWLIAVAREVS